MPNAQGTSESLIFGPETSFKTMPATPNGDKLPVVGPSFRPTRNKFSSKSLTGSPEPRSIILGKLSIDGEFTLDCNPASMQAVLAGVFGSKRQYGVGPTYVADYYLGPLQPYFFQQGHSDIGKYLLFNGGYFGTLGLSIATEGTMEAKVGIKAAKQTNYSSSQVTGTVTDRTGYEPFSYQLVRIKQGGTVIGYSQQLDLNIDRKLGNAASQDGSNEQAVIFSEIAEISGSLTALFPDTTLLDAALGGAETSLEIWLPSNNGSGVLFEMATIRFRPGQITTNGTGLVQQKLEFDVYGKAGASRYAARSWSSYFADASLPTLTGTTLIVSADGGANQTITFQAGDNTLDLLATRINTTATGFTASVDRHAGDAGGVLRLESSTKGTGSSIAVQASSTADTLLGIDNNSHTGLDGKSIVATVYSPLAA
ncbi:MAG: hypothetical protein JWO56_3245 [Acidobacteria bacterium]|nr:hypothetical protein [Acidobacteriota bacterium]